MIVALLPLYVRGGDHFISLDFYYGAAVLPFLFLAFADAWNRLWRNPPLQKKPALKCGVALLLVLFNGISLKPLHFTSDDLKTIRIAGSFSPGEVVVTQGHLLPYFSYRKENFYLSPHYEKNPSSQKAYLNPDAYYFDLEANPYPLDSERLKKEVERLRKNRRYTVSFEDARRIIFKRKK